MLKDSIWQDTRKARCRWVVLIGGLVLAGLLNAETRGSGPTGPGIPEIRTAIESYQAGLALSEPADRMAAFRKAEIAFASLLQGAPANESGYAADLYVSWGNAAIQVNDPGTAVLAFRKALLVDPLHSQALQNLEYLRTQLPDWVRSANQQGTLWQRLFFWKQLVGATTLQLVTSLLFLAGCILLAVSIRFRLVSFRVLALLPLSVWLVLLISLVVDLEKGSNGQAVFVAEESECRSADSANSPPSLNAPIPAGTEALVLEQREDWVEVEVGNRKRGWVPRNAIMVVN